MGEWDLLFRGIREGGFVFSVLVYFCYWLIFLEFKCFYFKGFFYLSLNVRGGVIFYIFILIIFKL